MSNTNQTKQVERKLYADRDAEALGWFYVRHVMAMTAEHLDDKGDIAAELAHRDSLLAQAKAVLEQMEYRGPTLTRRSCPACHWSAPDTKDPDYPIGHAPGCPIAALLEQLEQP